MQNRTPTSERKINRIYSYLDELASTDELDESYIDDVLDLMQQYSQLIANIRNARMV